MIDMNKKYTTRDGHPVRLLCVDQQASGGQKLTYCVVGLVMRNGEEVLHQWTYDGFYYGERTPHPYNLIEEIPSVVSFHTVYSNNLQLGGCYATLQLAKECAGANCPGVLEIIRKGSTVTTKFHPKEQA